MPVFSALVPFRRLPLILAAALAGGAGTPGTVHAQIQTQFFNFMGGSLLGDAFSDKFNWGQNNIPGSGDDFNVRTPRQALLTINYDQPSAISYGGVEFTGDAEVRNGRISGRLLRFFGQESRGVKLLSGTFVRGSLSRIEARRGGYVQIFGLGVDGDVVLHAGSENYNYGIDPQRGLDSVLEIHRAVAGPGAISIETEIDPTQPDSTSYVAFLEANNFTGPLTVKKDAQLKIFKETGLGATTAGTTVAEGGTLWLEAGSPHFIAEPLVMEGAFRTFVTTPGTESGQTFSGTISGSGVWTPDAPLLFTGVLSGGHGYAKSSGQAAGRRVTLGGNFPNDSRFGFNTQVDVFLDKPAGVIAAGGFTAFNKATVLWGRNNQITGTGGVVLDDGVADLNDKTQTLRSLTLVNGGAVRTGFSGSLRVNDRLSTSSDRAAAAPALISGNLLIGSAALLTAVQSGAPRIGLDISATVNPAIAGASINLTQGGLLRLSGVCTVPVALANATLEVTSDSPAMPVNLGNFGTSHFRARLTGTGTVGAITAVGSFGRKVAPGITGPGILKCGNVAWTSTFSSPEENTGFEVDVQGTAAGTGYDQLAVTGTVELGNADLTLNEGNFTPPPGTSFTIISNDGTEPVAGTFQDLPQGAVYGRYRISYIGGTGNDVVLTAFSQATGVTRTWTGNGADANWSTTENWSPAGAVRNGDAVVFPAGAARRTNVNNRTNLAVQSISITGGGYSISGNALALAGGLAVSGPVLLNHGINLPLNLTGPQTFSIGPQFLQLGGNIETNGMPLTFAVNGTPGVSSITCGGVISGGTGDQFLKTGGGRLTLANANTTRGNFRIAAGEVQLTHSAALGSRLGDTLVETGAQLTLAGTGLVLQEPIHLAGTLVIADHAGAVEIRQPLSCADTARLVVSATGVPQLTIFSEISGASLTKAGPGTLLLGGAIPKTLSTGFFLTEGRTIVSGTAGVLVLPGTTTVGTATTTAILEMRQRRTTTTGSHLIVNPGSTMIGDSQEISFDNVTLQGGTIATDGNGFTVNVQLTTLPSTVSSVLTGVVILQSDSNPWSVADGPAAIDLRVDAIIREQLPVRSSLRKIGPGSTVFNGANTLTEVDLVQGTNTWNSNSPATHLNVARLLMGTGRAAGLTLRGSSVLAPGTSAGTSPGLFTTGLLDMENGGTLRLELNGPAAGTGHDQIRCPGTTASVNLSGGTLQLIQGFTATPGQVLTIIDVQGTGPVIPFSSLPEAATVLAGSQRYRLSYAGGDGNDVTLTALAGTAPQSLSFSALETTTNAAEQTRTLSGEVTGGLNAAGLTIFLETSPNLRDWFPSGTHLADPNGTISFNFLQSQGQKTFFLRARLP